MNNNDGLNYKGKIKIKYIIGGKLVEIDQHNAGTSQLRYAFSQMLLGKIVASPNTIDIVTKPAEGSSEIPITILSRPVDYASFLNDREEANDHDWFTQFSFVLNVANFAQTPESAASYTAQLCNIQGNKKTILAEFTIDGTSLASISEGTQALIEWTLYIKKNEGE